MNEQEIKQAIQKTVIALAKEPQNAEHYHELAKYYAMQEQYDKVISIYESLLAFNPNDMEALLKSVSDLEKKAESIIKLEEEWNNINEEIKLEEPNHRNHQYIKSNLKTIDSNGYSKKSSVNVIPVSPTAVDLHKSAT